MNSFQRIAARMALAALVLAPIPFQALSTENTATQNSAAPTAERDGSHDFDPLLGSWKFHLKRRLKPLTGSNTWVDFEGTGVCRAIYDGSQIDQVDLSGPDGRIEGLTLRTYNPTSHQWRLYWANKKVGVLDPPQIGEFKNGVGEFFAQDTQYTIDKKAILVRFRWTNLNTTPHFEQSFSDDGGTTWEVNWITDQTRISDTGTR
jgi:hypothetical protein